MFKESINFNLKKPKPIIENKGNVLAGYKKGESNEALNIINDDCPGSQEISNLSADQKANLFLNKYQNDPLQFFSTENFNYLKSLNYNDRRMAKIAAFTNALPQECIVQYYQEFPEDKAIENIGLKLYTSLDDYTWSDDARIDNQEYDQALDKVYEINLFLDKNIRLIKNDPEVFDYFLENYKTFIPQIIKDAQRLNKIIDDSFFQKDSVFSETFSAIVSRIEMKLLELEKSLKSGGSPSKEVADFIKDLNLDSRERTHTIAELGAIASQLNEQYRQFGDNVFDGIAAIYNTSSEKIADNDLFDLVKEYGPETRESIMADFSEHKKFSADRIKELIESYQDLAEAESFSSVAMRKVAKEFEDEEKKYGVGGVKDFSWTTRAEEYNKKFPQPKSKEQILYEETISKLQQLLPLQIALEKKIDQLVYGREEVQLPKWFNDLENSPVTPENIPEQAPLYFPVGISKDLPSWENVLNNEKKFAKPIDLYGYLFWLNNQNREIKLVICDEIQVNNYAKRYHKDESEAREEAIQIGKQEAIRYQQIIQTFGLKNVKLQNYRDFLNENKEAYNNYKLVVKNLADQPTFHEAFLAMVQESVSGAEKEEYINYALEELAWILSTNGTKIGHLNEARYDILATVIRNTEQIGKDKGIDVFNNLESSEAKLILNTVVKIVRDSINEKKSKLDKNSASLAYFQRLQEHLGKMKVDSSVGLDKTIKKDSLSLNFVCPDVGSASFGFRGDFEEKESVVKFKEPYSTYFYTTEADLLINSDQVVATSEGFIGGKILTLDSKKQLIYAEKVVKPILKHYFVSLDKAPVEYFEKINKSREELLNEAKEATSLLATLRFIQKYIVKPTEVL